MPRRKKKSAETALLQGDGTDRMTTSPKLSLSVQYADARLKERLPRSTLRRWAAAGLSASKQCPGAELTLRFVDAQEGRSLNRTYRNKDYATNVLTFAYQSGGRGKSVQADIVLCTDVVQSEAAERGITIQAHAAHLVVHGVLHALGHEHENDADAQEMEGLERDILAKLGFTDPYVAGA
jgi:probable rRNA maturation factor